MLSDAERLVLEMYCPGHAVAACDTCRRGYKLGELGVDIIGRRYYFCPSCRLNLLDRIRLHILSCPAIAAALEERILRSEQTVRESYKRTSQSAILASESLERAYRVLDARRQSRHVPPQPHVLLQVAAMLLGRQQICANCAGIAAGVSAQTVLRNLDGIEEHVRVAMRRGTCLVCERRDVLVLSFAEKE